MQRKGEPLTESLQLSTLVRYAVLLRVAFHNYTIQSKYPILPSKIPLFVIPCHIFTSYDVYYYTSSSSAQQNTIACTAVALILE